jgi:hypothetical protein
MKPLDITSDERCRVTERFRVWTGQSLSIAFYASLVIARLARQRRHRVFGCLTLVVFLTAFLVYAWPPFVPLTPHIVHSRTGSLSHRASDHRASIDDLATNTPVSLLHQHLFAASLSHSLAKTFLLTGTCAMYFSRSLRFVSRGPRMFLSHES